MNRDTNTPPEIGLRWSPRCPISRSASALRGRQTLRRRRSPALRRDRLRRNPRRLRPRLWGLSPDGSNKRSPHDRFRQRGGDNRPPTDPRLDGEVLRVCEALHVRLEEITSQDL
jgi:hypothetical protein